jgi:flavin reductase (DIM6/NTAB) family NADH-FMN oxidoreductase RutF
MSAAVTALPIAGPLPSPVPRTPVGDQEFRDLMSLFPTGVSVIASVDADGQPHGMTCTSLCSVSTAPPTVVVCLRSDSVTHSAVTERGDFTLSLLRAGAEETALRFAVPGPVAFDETPWQSSPSGLPWLEQHAVATAECRTAHITDVGDHSIVVGVVAATSFADDDKPLLYGLRRFATWTPIDDEETR